jgi:hypothetical protein
MIDPRPHRTDARPFALLLENPAILAHDDFEHTRDRFLNSKENPAGDMVRGRVEISASHGGPDQVRLARFRIQKTLSGK